MATSSGDPERLMVYINPEKCMGCKSCEIACAIEHSLSKNLFEAIFESPLPKARTKVIVADLFNVPMRCQHCEDAPCINVCPTGAITKTPEGFISLKTEKCIGCLMCVLACPFGHPRYESEYKSVLKCGFCADRVREGRLPACVEACPTGALLFGTVEEIMDEVKKESAERLVQGLKTPEVVLVKAEPAKGETPTGVKPTDVYLAYLKVKWY